MPTLQALDLSRWGDVFKRHPWVWASPVNWYLHNGQALNVWPAYGLWRMFLSLRFGSNTQQCLWSLACPSLQAGPPYTITGWNRLRVNRLPAIYKHVGKLLLRATEAIMHDSMRLVVTAIELGLLLYTTTAALPTAKLFFLVHKLSMQTNPVLSPGRVQSILQQTGVCIMTVFMLFAVSHFKVFPKRC